MAEKDRPSFLFKLARFGAFSIGVVYILVGVVAILSLLRVRYGGADEDSILDLLTRIPLGEVFIALILLGMLGYIIWRFYEAIKDPYEYGSGFKGIAKRAGVAASALAYAIIALSAIQALLGKKLNTHGYPVEQRLMVAKIFHWAAGEWIIGAFGVIVGITGLVQLLYVIRKSYKEELRIKALSKTKKIVIHAFAWAGYLARGTILLIIAYFLVKASIQSDPQEVVNTDKAFNFLGEQVNHTSFVLVAVGTICYGLFMFALGIYYNFGQRDERS